MNIFQMFGMYLGRLLLSAIFLISAIQEMLGWASTEQYFLMSMTRWMNSFHANEFISTLLSNLFPWMPWLLLVAVVFKLIGSVLLVLGLNVRLGALLLIVFLVPTTLIVHSFWSLPVQERPLEMVLFMKNVSILGGLLVVLAVGSGKALSKSG